MRPDLLQPIFALGKKREGGGAKVAVPKLHAGPDDANVGLDDHLCALRRQAFGALPRLPLKHPAFSRGSAWWRGWVKRKEDPADDTRTDAARSSKSSAVASPPAPPGPRRRRRRLVVRAPGRRCARADHVPPPGAPSGSAPG